MSNIIQFDYETFYKYYTNDEHLKINKTKPPKIRSSHSLTNYFIYKKNKIILDSKMHSHFHRNPFSPESSNFNSLIRLETVSISLFYKLDMYHSYLLYKNIYNENK